MQANHKIGYHTSLDDVIEMVLQDFGVVISEEDASCIIESNNRGCIVWTPEHIISTIPLFKIDKSGIVYPTK